jgi:hypothetical protein
MTTSLKVILAAAAIGVLTSPVMAQGVVSRPSIAESAATISNARGSYVHGSVAGARTEVAAPVSEQTRRSSSTAKSSPIHDCVTPALASCM